MNQARKPTPGVAAPLEGRLELLEAVVLNANDAVVVTEADEAGEPRIVFVNPAFTAQTGYEPTEVIGRHPRLLVGPGTDEGAQSAVRLAVEERRATTVELLHYRKDGSPFWVENAVSPIRAVDSQVRYVVSVQRDITERREASDALRQSEGRLEALLMHTSDIITVLEADGTVRYSNPNAAEMLGLVPGAVNGTSAMELVHHEDRERVIGALTRAVTSRGETARVEFRIQYADGVWHDVEAIANNCLDDALAGIVVTVHDVTERTQFERELSHQALHDQLTGLPNRTLLLDRLDHALVSSRRKDTTVAVLFMDLDRFKLLNDSFGHHAGDQLLREMARRLQERIRPGDTVSRFGGDEFVVLCDEVAGPLEAVVIAERVLATLNEPFALDGAEVFAGASIGVSVAAGEAATADALVRDADAAMYRAKDRGRGRVELFDDRMRAQAVQRLRTETELRRAVDGQQFVVHYQPLFQLDEPRRVVGIEALVRWDHPRLGMIPPASFIPVAEENGLIVPIGAWVLQQATMERAGAPIDDDVVVWVNVSARELSDPALLPSVDAALQRSGLPATSLGLEITETGLMEEADVAVEVLSDLKARGVKLALDDFGTGYSSLGYLTRLPVDTLKVDRSFVNALGSDEGASAVLRAVLGLARSLSLAVVAEGVETEAQLALLREMGFTCGQGFLLARPAPAPEVWTLFPGSAR